MDGSGGEGDETRGRSDKQQLLLIRLVHLHSWVKKDANAIWLHTFSLTDDAESTTPWILIHLPDA